MKAEKISLCLFLLMAEFLSTSRNVLDSLSTSRRWVRSSRQDCSAFFSEAALKRDPAYLPEGVSVKAGALWPAWVREYLRLTARPLRRRRCWP